MAGSCEAKSDSTRLEGRWEWEKQNGPSEVGSPPPLGVARFFCQQATDLSAGRSGLGCWYKGHRIGIVQKVWTFLALVFIAAIFYRVAYVVPHNTCNDIWLEADRQQTDPERADFIAQCVHAVVVSDYFDAAYWEAKAQRP